MDLPDEGVGVYIWVGGVKQEGYRLNGSWWLGREDPPEDVQLADADVEAWEPVG
ncbi:MAG: hypothetical protein RIR91_335 [Verrucomicrobiota bacterium]|jgi:hypothetical protein